MCPVSLSSSLPQCLNVYVVLFQETLRIVIASPSSRYGSSYYANCAGISAGSSTIRYGRPSLVEILASVARL